VAEIINIIYQPGYGGHFLKCLFSLDSKVAPLMGDTDDITERLNRYNFNKSTKFNNYFSFHIHNDSQFDINKYMDSYEKIVIASHPYHIFLSPNIAATKFIVDLNYSEFNDYWLVESKKRMGNFPPTLVGEYYREMELRKTSPMVSISLDKFLDETMWESEYYRISELMGIDTHINEAKILYNSWYNVRVAELKESFKKLTDVQLRSFQDTRLLHEMHGNDGNWQNFYQRNRGANWPEFSNTLKFSELPIFVQNELMKKFLLVSAFADPQLVREDNQHP
jgi:hypothetical protein